MSLGLEWDRTSTEVEYQVWGTHDPEADWTMLSTHTDRGDAERDARRSAQQVPGFGREEKPYRAIVEVTTTTTHVVVDELTYGEAP